MNQPKIKEFFKVTKKGNNNYEVEEDNYVLESERFYDNCLLNMCDKQICLEEKSNQKEKIIELSNKCEQIESAIASVNSIIKDKDHEIDTLRKNLEATKIQHLQITPLENTPALNYSQIAQTTSLANGTPTLNKKVEVMDAGLSFVKFSEKFRDSQLAQLRSIGPTIRDDSTFITTLMKFLYNGKFDTLMNKSVSGRGRTKAEKKEKITPEKNSLMTEMFSERINEVTTDINDRNNRIKHFNKYIKDAIANINRFEKCKKEQADVCRQLALDFNLNKQ